MSGSSRPILVTGGTRGLGARIVDSFLEQGDRVATCGRTATEQIEAWAANPELAERFHFEALDVTDGTARRELVDATLARFGGIDVLINNAGLAREGVLALLEDEDIDALIDVNLRATVHLTKLAVRRMLRQGSGGRIINVSSVVGLSGYRGLTVYSATKAALDGFTRALARELGSRGITVNSVAPGYLRTEMTETLSRGQLDQIVRRTPVGRLGEAADVVGAVRYLASAEASFVSGQVITVDGGLTA